MKHNRRVPTIESLEGTVWPDETQYESALVERCHNLRRKPLSRFTVEDFRTMILQDIGTKFLLPRAIRILKRNPFASGDFCDGDLLDSVMELPSVYWKQPDHAKEVLKVLEKAIDKKSKRKDIDPALIDKIERFRQKLKVAMGRITSR